MAGVDGLLRELLGFLLGACCLAYLGEPDQSEGLAGTCGPPGELFGFVSVSGLFPLSGETGERAGVSYTSGTLVEAVCFVAGCRAASLPDGGNPDQRRRVAGFGGELSQSFGPLSGSFELSRLGQADERSGVSCRRGSHGEHFGLFTVTVGFTDLGELAQSPWSRASNSS